MDYKEWMAQHAEKHWKIIEKLRAAGYDKPRMIDYFDYDNMRKNEPDFCPLYAAGEKCHPMEKLNCYLCGCHHFRFTGQPVDGRFSRCAINNPSGADRETPEGIHQDCSGCFLPHRESTIRKYFSPTWWRIMKNCDEG